MKSSNWHKRHREPAEPCTAFVHTDMLPGRAEPVTLTFREYNTGRFMTVNMTQAEARSLAASLNSSAAHDLPPAPVTVTN